jgi:hypothetical protein
MPDGAEIGKNALGAVHIAGSIVLGAFGMGNVAQGIGKLEDQAGILPEWAGGTKRPPPPPPPPAPKEAAKPSGGFRWPPPASSPAPPSPAPPSSPAPAPSDLQALWAELLRLRAENEALRQRLMGAAPPDRPPAARPAPQFLPRKPA